MNQQVTPRHRTATRNFLRFGKNQSAVRGLQRGSVDHSTITIAAGTFALLLVGLVGFFYLQQVVGTASQGTDVRALEQELSELREQQRTLELEGAQLRSLQTVEDRTQRLNLVEAGEVSYLAAEDDRVAITVNDYNSAR